MAHEFQNECIIGRGIKQEKIRRRAKVKGGGVARILKMEVVPKMSYARLKLETIGEP